MTKVDHHPSTTLGKEEPGPEELNEEELTTRELFRLGTEALAAKEYQAAERLLRLALNDERSPDHLSQYALALAHHKGDLKTAVALCQEAVKTDHRNPEQFLRLGTLYLMAGQTKQAIRTLQLGLRVGRHPGILKQLQALGRRQKPMLPFLSRAHPLNKYLGKIKMTLMKQR
jgi:tetratricopeptide (TPR) repeat protein